MIEVQQYSRVSFQIHNAMMKEFRRSHDRVALLVPTKVNGHSLAGKTAPLAIRCVKADFGGSHLPELNTGLSASLLLPRVADYKLPFN